MSTSVNSTRAISGSGVGSVMSRAAVALLLPLALIGGFVVFFSPKPPDPCLAVGPLTASVDVAAEPVPLSKPAAALSVRVATWNTYKFNTTARVIAGMRALAQTADVVGVQELSNDRRRAQVVAAMRKEGFAATTGSNAVPIFWRISRFTPLTHGAVKVFDLEKVEAGTAGTVIGPKWLSYAQLQDRHTGATFTELNHHLVVDIDRNGRPAPGHDRRVELAGQQIAAFTTLAAKFGAYGPVMGGADWNIDAAEDEKIRDPRMLTAQLQAGGMVTNWSRLGFGTGPSHGSRWIDAVAITAGSATFVSQERGASHGSDHRPISVVVRKRLPGSSGQTGGVGAAASGNGAAGAGQVPSSLVVQVDGKPVTLDAEQLGIAATVIREGKALGIPARGWIVAIAAAGAESGIRNLDHGDRDSVNPWQMRPSTGWGTVAQLMDVPTAVRAFYGLAAHTDNRGLTDIPDWQQLTIAEAAQAVEVSAYPSAYERWVSAAERVVQELSGLGPVTDDGCGPAVSALQGDCPTTRYPAEQILSSDGLLVMRCTKAQFPTIDDIGTYPGHKPDQTRAVDFMIPDWQQASGRRLGDQVATWIRAHQRELGVQYVIWNGKIWNVERDADGWRPYFAADSPDPNQSHANHVHVSVYGDRGTGPAGADQTGSGLTAAGSWRSPVGQPSRVGCGWGCYRGHSSQDFPAAPGIPVYAVTGGTVVRSESIMPGGRTCTQLPICGSNRVSYGNLLVLELAGTTKTTAWYAHLSARNVAVGQVVRAGQVIGAVGYEGNVRPKGPGGSHLHFEIRTNGDPVDPMPYLATKGVQP